MRHIKAYIFDLGFVLAAFTLALMGVGVAVILLSAAASHGLGQ